MTSDPGGPSPRSALQDYVVRLHADVVAERDRLDKRGDTLVSTSGGLVTLVAAATALIPKPSGGLEVPRAVVVLLLAGLVMFLVAIVMSQLSWLGITFGRRTMWAEIKSVATAFATSRGTTSSTDADSIIEGLIGINVAEVASLRAQNEVRFVQLRWAGLAQMIAVCLLVLAAATLLWTWQF